MGTDGKYRKANGGPQWGCSSSYGKHRKWQNHCGLNNYNGLE